MVAGVALLGASSLAADVPKGNKGKPLPNGETPLSHLLRIARPCTGMCECNENLARITPLRRLQGPCLTEPKRLTLPYPRTGKHVCEDGMWTEHSNEELARGDALPHVRGSLSPRASCTQTGRRFSGQPPPWQRVEGSPDTARRLASPPRARSNAGAIRRASAGPGPPWSDAAGAQRATVTAQCRPCSSIEAALLYMHAIHARPALSLLPRRVVRARAASGGARLVNSRGFWVFPPAPRARSHAPPPLASSLTLRSLPNDEDFPTWDPYLKARRDEISPSDLSPAV